MKKSFAEMIVAADLMSSGIKSRLDEVKSEKLDEERAARIESLARAAKEQNAEQEALKARQKAKTAELEATLSALDKELADAKKRVKLALPQEAWKEFGIDDKK